MEGLFVLAGVTSVLAVLGALAARFGVDSRDGSTDPRSPQPGLTV